MSITISTIYLYDDSRWEKSQENFEVSDLLRGSLLLQRTLEFDQSVFINM